MRPSEKWFDENADAAREIENDLRAWSRATDEMMDRIDPVERSLLVAFIVDAVWSECCGDEPVYVLTEKARAMFRGEYVQADGEQWVMTARTEPASEDTREWAWQYDGDDACHGTFATRADAEANARSRTTLDEMCCVIYGRVTWPDPGKYFRANADGMSEDADERADDDGCYSGDKPLFTAADDAAAQADLDEVIAAWARRHYSADVWSFEEEDA